MEVLFDRVAGLDVGKESVTVCVRRPGPRGGRRSETRTFKTMFGSLRVMRDWLAEAGVTVAAMESTSTYWKPPFYCLEEVMDVWLLNAAHMKAVPGPEERCPGRGVDRAAARARLVGAVVRAATGDPSTADVDPLPGAADGRPDPGDDPVGADARGRLHQAVLGRLQPEHGVGAGHAAGDDSRASPARSCWRRWRGVGCGRRSPTWRRR
jgi:Transposase